MIGVAVFPLPRNRTCLGGVNLRLVVRLLAIACVPLFVTACGDRSRERADAEFQAANQLIEAGQYEEARAALRGAVLRHPDDRRLASGLAEIEGLLSPGTRPRDTRRPSWVDSLRAKVDAAEAARANDDMTTAKEAAQTAMFLFDSAPTEIEDQLLLRRVVALKRWLDDVGTK